VLSPQFVIFDREANRTMVNVALIAMVREWKDATGAGCELTLITGEKLRAAVSFDEVEKTLKQMRGDW
jgi:hypothetical protein